MVLNEVVAISNLYALRSILSVYENNIFLAVIIFSAMTSSFLYHLFERDYDHNITPNIRFFGYNELPGQPFIYSKYEEKLLLNLDRFCAFTLVGYIIIFYSQRLLDVEKLSVAFCSLLCLILPRIFNEPFLFTVFHVCWHVLAFHLCYLITNEK